MNQPNILIISIDSLRADAVGLMSPNLATTPFLDKFSTNATVFESAFSQADWTVPSHTSIFTGLYPTEHGVVTSSDSLGDHPTLAELLSKEGYHSAANFRLNWFTGGGILRGFDECDAIGGTNSGGIRHHIKSLVKRSSILRRIARGIYRGSFRGHMHDENVVNSAIDALQAAKEPFCHFVHLNDAHWPYSPTAPFHKAATDRPTWQLAWNRAYTQQTLFDENNPTSPAPMQQMEVTKELYLGAVRQVDHHLKRIVTCIPEEILENTIIVIFGDHGDAFGEKGEIGHNAPIPEVTHVPMVIKDSTGQLPPSRIGSTVQLIDLYPTLADLAAVDFPVTSATNLVRNDPTGVAFTHTGEPSENEYYLDEYVVWRSPNDYVRWDYRKDEFFECGRSDGLREILDHHVSNLGYIPPKSRDEMDQQTTRQLKDLGYLT